MPSTFVPYPTVRRWALTFGLHPREKPFDGVANGCDGVCRLAVDCGRKQFGTRFREVREHLGAGRRFLEQRPERSGEVLRRESLVEQLGDDAAVSNEIGHRDR